MILTGFGAVLGTVLVYLLLDAFAGYRRGAGKGKPRALGVCMTAAYLGVILWFTLRRVPTAEQRIHLTPLWTLRFWDQADMRWQSYMNVFLFLPLGFLLPWTLNRPLWQTLLIGLALFFGRISVHPAAVRHTSNNTMERAKIFFISTPHIINLFCSAYSIILYDLSQDVKPPCSPNGRKQLTQKSSGRLPCRRIILLIFYRSPSWCRRRRS